MIDNPELCQSAGNYDLMRSLVVQAEIAVEIDPYLLSLAPTQSTVDLLTQRPASAIKLENPEADSVYT
jgi:hypothetical protein